MFEPTKPETLKELRLDDKKKPVRKSPEQICREQTGVRNSEGRNVGEKRSQLYYFSNQGD